MLQLYIQRKCWCTSPQPSLWWPVRCGDDWHRDMSSWTALCGKQKSMKSCSNMNGSRKQYSGVAKAFPGGRVAHLEGQMRKKMRKVWGKIRKLEWNLRKVELSPTRDYEAGYSPEAVDLHVWVLNTNLWEGTVKCVCVCVCGGGDKDLVIAIVPMGKMKKYPVAFSSWYFSFL